MFVAVSLGSGNFPLELPGSTIPNRAMVPAYSTSNPWDEAAEADRLDLRLGGPCQSHQIPDDPGNAMSLFQDDLEVLPFLL